MQVQSTASLPLLCFACLGDCVVWRAVALPPPPPPTVLSCFACPMSCISVPSRLRASSESWRRLTRTGSGAGRRAVGDEAGVGEWWLPTESWRAASTAWLTRASLRLVSSCPEEKQRVLILTAYQRLDSPASRTAGVRRVKGCNLGCEATLSDSRYKDLSYTYMPSNQMFVVSKRLTDSWRAVGGGGAWAATTRCPGAPPHYGHGSRGFWLDPALCVLCVPALQLGFWLRGVQP